MDGAAAGSGVIAGIRFDTPQPLEYERGHNKASDSQRSPDPTHFWEMIASPRPVCSPWPDPARRCEIIDALPLCVEDTPMTMHIGIRARDQSIVLASDRMWRVQEKFYGSGNPVTEPQYRSKVVFSERHELAIALAGGGSIDANPTKELADYLSRQDEIPDNLEPLLKEWGDKLFLKEYPEYARNRLRLPRDSYSILIINPKTTHCCFWKLFVNCPSVCRESSRYMVSGDDTSWAVFWPQYLKAGSGLLSLDEATGVAATTILMGHVLSPSAVDDLEIWRHNKTWSEFDPAQITAIKAGFRAFEERTKASVFTLAAREDPIEFGQKQQE